MYYESFRAEACLTPRARIINHYIFHDDAWPLLASFPHRMPVKAAYVSGDVENMRREGAAGLAAAVHVYLHEMGEDQTPHIAAFLIGREEHWSAEIAPRSRRDRVEIAPIYSAAAADDIATTGGT